MKERNFKEGGEQVIPINRGRAEQIDGAMLHLGKMSLDDLMEVRRNADARASDALFELAIIDDHIARVQAHSGPDGGTT